MYGSGTRYGWYQQPLLTCTQEQLKLKIPTPERLSSVTLAGNGCYVVGGGQSGKMYTWEVLSSTKRSQVLMSAQVQSGRLLTVVTNAHFRRVTTLCASSTGTHVFSGGEDALVHCWRLARYCFRCAVSDLGQSCWKCRRWSSPKAPKHMEQSCTPHQGYLVWCWRPGCSCSHSLEGSHLQGP